MRTRRLIAAPVVALVAILLVAAVIDAGKRDRLAATTQPSVWQPRSTQHLVERERLDRIERLAEACVGPVECTADGHVARLTAAAEQVRSAPADPRFTPVRRATETLLRERALLVTLERSADADGTRTNAERARIDEQRDVVRRARLEAIDERHATGLIDAAGREHLRSAARDAD